MPTIKLASLKIDSKAETEGEWIAINRWTGLNPQHPYDVTELPGLKFHVRSLNNSSYRLARQKAAEGLEKAKKDYPGEIIPDDVAAAAEGKLIDEELLLGWEGFDEAYSKPLAADMLCHPDGRTLREMVTFCAARVGKREVEFIKDAEKNSERQPKSR